MGMAGWQLRVGAVQMRSGDDVAATRATVTALSAQAAADGAQLVVLPECFAFLGRGERDKLVHAEAIAQDGDGGDAAAPAACSARCASSRPSTACG